MSGGRPRRSAVAPRAPATRADVVVFAAGSLRAPLADVAKAFEARSGGSVALTFGPSGLLRDRIGSGEAADVFASANTEHPRGLAAFGWAHADRALLLADGRPLALDSVDRALSAENVGRLYRVPVRRVDMGGQRRIIVDG